MDFNATVATWKNVLINPTLEAYAEELEKPQATLRTALIWAILAGLLVGILNVIRVFVFDAVGIGPGDLAEQILAQADLPAAQVDQIMSQMQLMTSGNLFASLCSGIFSVPLGLLISSGIYWIIARILGGTGSYSSQTYLMAAFGIPLAILNGLVSILPYLGSVIGLVILVYGLFLLYYSLKATHAFTSGKAISTIVIPWLIAFILGCCGLIGAAGLIAAALGS